MAETRIWNNSVNNKISGDALDALPCCSSHHTCTRSYMPLQHESIHSTFFGIGIFCSCTSSSPVRAYTCSFLSLSRSALLRYFSACLSTRSSCTPTSTFSLKRNIRSKALGSQFFCTHIHPSFSSLES